MGTMMGRSMGRGDEASAQGYGFPTVAAVLPDPFPPGSDPGSVRLPTVPRVRSAEDDEPHHRAYWQAHVWEALLRYRRAFADPACTSWLRSSYDRVESEALQLVTRATGTFPISPIDSVACHAALKDLRHGSVSLEETVRALRGTSVERVPVAAGDPAGTAMVVGGSPSGSGGQDFFASASSGRSFEFKLSLRGARGLRRSRTLAGAPPAEAADAD